MSHTNQTANYHLPQFIGTDKPAWLVDVNQAMADIDTQMKANETASATAEADAQSALSGVTALNSQVGTLQTSVTTLETQAPLDEAQIETNRQNIATNAQNIVDLDNRMGHTSISGIGDGSATGAIKAVDDKVGDLADLDTTDKSSIVDAINEVAQGAGGTASSVSYDNTDSGLTATNVQDAIDEINEDSKLNDLDPAVNINAYNSFANAYTVPTDGYVYVYCAATVNGTEVKVFGSKATSDTDPHFNVSAVSQYECISTLVRKGMKLVVQASGQSSASFLALK